MCVVSMVTDWGQKKYPDWITWPTTTEMFPTPREKIVDYKEYLELVRKAEEYDRMTGQPDCIDPDKDKFLKALEKRVELLEKINKPKFVERD